MASSWKSTRYFDLRVILRRHLQQLAPGDPVPTLRSLMTKFSCSQATIVRAIEPLKAEGLIVRRDGQRGLFIGTSVKPAEYNLALIRPSLPSWDYDEISRSVVDELHKINWSVTQIYYRNLNEVNLNDAIGENDAGILLPYPVLTKDSTKLLDHLRSPLLMLHESLLDCDLPIVHVDNYNIGYQGTRHLQRLGHRKILGLFNQLHVPSTLNRISGWRQAMTDNGMSLTELQKYYLDFPPLNEGSSLHCCYDLFSRWFERQKHPEFTGIFCASFTGCLAAMRVLREHGIRIPEDVSILTYVGESKEWLPYLNPPLSSIEIDTTQYGAKVADVLRRIFSGGEFSDSELHIALPPFLVERGTTATCRSHS